MFYRLIFIVSSLNILSELVYKCEFQCKSLRNVLISHLKHRKIRVYYNRFILKYTLETSFIVSFSSFHTKNNTQNHQSSLLLSFLSNILITNPHPFQLHRIHVKTPIKNIININVFVNPFNIAISDSILIVFNIEIKIWEKHLQPQHHLDND